MTCLSLRVDPLCLTAARIVQDFVDRAAPSARDSFIRPVAPPAVLPMRERVRAASAYQTARLNF
jgi:hypothetical protein